MTTQTITRSASGPGTIYRSLVKQAIDRHAKNARVVVTEPSPVKWTNDNVVVVETAPVPVEIVTPEPAPANLAEIAREAARGVVSSDPVPFRPTPRDGFPKKGDSFHIVTLTNNIYNGFKLPLNERADYYPVYMVANQNGELMQVPSDSDWLEARKGSPKRIPALSWLVRTVFLSGDEALNEALRDIKRLKQWQNWTYGKAATESLDEIRLNVKKHDNFTFDVMTNTLKQAVKDVSKKAYIEFSGLAFPVKFIQEIVKLASDDIIRVVLDNSYTHKITKWKIENKGTRNEKKVPDGYTEVKTPALIMRHGMTKTVIYGATLATLTSNDSDTLVIHCAI